VRRPTLAPGIAAFSAAIAVALLGLYARADSPEPPPATGVVKLRLLGINDLHGHIEPPQQGLGGAAWLAADLDRATLPGRTIKVHAGDLVGASPLASAWFHDEPSIEVANSIGFDVATLGNHEFDEGVDELRRLLDGGRRTGAGALERDADGRLVNTSTPGFEGARFPYTSANVADPDGKLLLPPYEIVERAGVRVGFIGVTTPTAPTYLLPRYADGFRFTDMSDAVNRWVPDLRRRGVEAIVVLAHSGAPSQEGDGRDASGQIVDEVRQMDDAVDVVVAGHSHTLLDLRIPNRPGPGHKLVVESLAYGTAFDQVDIEVDRATGDVVSKAAKVPRTWHAGLRPDPAVAAIVSRYRERLRPLASRVVGSAAAPLSADSGLGRLAAEAQRAFARADLALVDAGSFRARIGAGPITYAELFATQAYDHPLVKMRMTGAELLGILNAGSGPSLYTAGADAHSLDRRASYTVVANALLAGAGPFEALRAAAGRGEELGSQVEALAAYVERLREPLEPSRPQSTVSPAASSAPLFLCPIAA
jgi:5'-nucleotidase